MKNDDEPDFYDEVFNPKDFLRRDYEVPDTYTARLSRNISKLKSSIAALAAAGFVERAGEMTNRPVYIETVIGKRLEFP